MKSAMANFVALGVVGGFAVLIEMMNPFIRAVPSPEWYKYSYPMTKPETVPPRTLFCTTIFAPTCLVLCNLLLLKLLLRWPKDRVQDEAKRSAFAFTSTMLWTLLVTALIKRCYGGLRPDFLSRCFPQEYATNRLDLETIPPIPQCTNQDERIVMQGRLSFPSGHTSHSFAAFVFCSLYIHHHLTKVWKCQLASLNFSVPLTVLLFPLWIGLTRTADYRHHSVDVVVGMLIGSVISVASFYKHFICAENGTTFEKASEDESSLLTADGDIESAVVGNTEARDFVL